MRTYDTYKDSGISWLGQIPSHWDVRRTKTIWEEHVSLSETGTEQLLSVSQYDGVKPNDEGSRSESLVGYKVVDSSNLVINIMLAWLGGLGVSQYNGIVSPAYCVYKLKENHCPEYFHYLYRTAMYLAEFARKSTGVVPSRWRMYTDSFGTVLSLVPPLAEQKAIVAYLDSATAEIDKAIASQQRMVELLQERKQIIINQAVTQGLNPAAPMKPTIIDWLPQIPAHWELKQLRFVVDFYDHLRAPITADQRERKNPQYDYYGASGVIDRIDHYNVDDKVLLIGEDGANLLLRNLPLIYRAQGKFWVNNHAHIIKPIKDDYEYIAYMLEAGDFTLYITGSAQPKLTQLNLKSFIVPIPPLAEQTAIVENIEIQTRPVNSAISRCERMIELLTERKQILINDVVTGKIKVV